MYLEYFFSSLNIGIAYHYLSVETSGTEKCGVKDINKELVKGLLTLIVTAAQSCASLAAYCVDLVDEDDRGGIFLCCFKKVSYSGSTDADKHLNEVGT